MEYICQYKKSIPSILCKEIIALFESEEDRYDGITASGMNKDIKDTTDFVIPKNDKKWQDIYYFLNKELGIKLKEYLKLLNKKEYSSKDHEYIFFNGQNLFNYNFMIQKYEKQKGKYIYHDDFDSRNTNFRVVTYLWYLNIVDVGGETEFWGNYKINPEEGKLLLFPAAWSYPHRGIVPISSNKYIITGWLYSNNY
jgi:hypothetical protein